MLLLEEDGSIRVYTYHFGKALLSFKALLEEAQTQEKKLADTINTHAKAHMGLPEYKLTLCIKMEIPLLE